MGIFRKVYDKIFTASALYLVSIHNLMKLGFENIAVLLCVVQNACVSKLLARKISFLYLRILNSCAVQSDTLKHHQNFRIIQTRDNPYLS